ncbi:methyl-accepting chemotaxis protein [Clostridium uliginosum]|uniref:Methyl-accepting chemotaxis protein n=1 Tax=Clostridium uliginosum TaxID=119641 RepID=A0A1I1IRW9_9CLOT|nr:methyl-accepting chemotaxis protein [Clostridium uliginosum]SFC38965.1 methyl-accepting chemotaxis protein [Clostridium uliginosum]
MKSIKIKMMVYLCLVMVAICIGLGAVSFINSSKALQSNLGTTLPKLAEETANNVQGRIEGQLNLLECIASIDQIKDINNTWENQLPILQNQAQRLGSIGIGLVDVNGDCKNTDGTTSNLKQRDYFQKALSGKSNVSDPLISSVDRSTIVVYAVPIKNNNEVIGVLTETRDGNRLSELTNEVKFGQTGISFMINKYGTTIAAGDKDLAINMSNQIEAAKKDTKLQHLADIEKKMIAGETGIDGCNYNGTYTYIGYSPVKDTDWYVGIMMSKSEILSELDSLKVTVVLSSVVFLLIGLIVIYFISNTISKGIKSTSKNLDLLANGNLCEEIPVKYLKQKDEIGTMTNSMKVMQESLRNMIRRIKDNSSNINMQSGNLSSVSEEIASVSQNVTEAISEIAKGTSTQSEDLINITDILNKFSDKLSGMVNEIQVVDSNSRGINSMANESNSQMNELNQSVTKVSNSFKIFYTKIVGLGKDINKINEMTNIINSVAEQTNLLALNAAIEAARAGESGKGFSVVADEIRKLAEQSKESSENISRLICSISKDSDVIVQDSVTMDDELISQVNIISNSITSFKKIIEAVNEVIPKIETVKNSAEDIDKDKNSILIRIDELSSISVEVSASSEEISASSEEMNASTEEVASAAQILNSMTNQMLEEVDKFKV